MKRRSTWLALLAAISLAMALTTSVSAHSAPGGGSITVHPEKSKVECGKWLEVRATVRDNQGKRLKGVVVTWSISPVVAGDQIKNVTSTTNKKGVAKTMVKFACVAGNRKITATTVTLTGVTLTGTAVVRVTNKHHDDDDGDKDDHDDGDNNDHEGDHGGDGHHEDGVAKKVGTQSQSVNVARSEAVLAGTNQRTVGAAPTSGQVYGAVKPSTANAVSASASVPAKSSTDPAPITALIAVLAGLAIIVRRLAFSRR